MSKTVKNGEKDYAGTLNLPKTSFPMKANLPKREPEIGSVWKEMNLYGVIRRKMKQSPKYILHDGPPYANGDIHLGTALNKILKDMIVKYRTMQGFDAPYVPGYDCHGLPIEFKVISELSEKEKDLPKPEIRRRCREYALKYVDIMTRDFERLGVLGQWDDPYLTLSHKYEHKIFTVFGEMYKQSYIYRGLKPITWCYSCRTALAEAEVEYADHTSPSIYVKFKVNKGLQDLGEGVYLLIWTTTPWTLPANLATAAHPDFDYVAVAVDSEIYLMADYLRPAVLEKIGADPRAKVLRRFKGKELAGISYEHPFIDRINPVIVGEHVTLEQGTGLVHTAPGHGQEDYVIGMKYNLPVFSPVDDYGRFTAETERFAGRHVFETNEEIIQLLRDKNALLHTEQLVHQYPHCWRCGNPIIFRATAQWFISLDTNALRARSLSEIKQVKWMPDWGEERIYGMVSNRPDWCISRQRSWGVPIPIFYCKACGKEFFEDAAFEHLKELVARHGVDVWFTRTAEELLPENTACACGSREFRKEEDILDVWFESGVSHRAVLETTEGLHFPADLYVEGSDQHRGWFQSSLLPSVAVKGRAPYKAVLTHGYVVTSDGKKMSKKLGNAIYPDEVIQKYGADVLRLWVASENFTQDIRVSFEILQRLADAYRRLRNTFKFLLSNLYDFDPALHSVDLERMDDIDRWALHVLQHVIERVTQAYENHEFYTAFHALYNYCTVSLSALYLDMLKDRLYTLAPANPLRRSSQTALNHILHALTRMLAPMITFTAEEVWRSIPNQADREQSVHLASWPRVQRRFIDDELGGNWEKLLELRSGVTKALEIARRDGLLGNSLEANIVLYPERTDEEALLRRFEKTLSTLFIVSQVELHAPGEAAPGDISVTENGLCVAVRKAAGAKCKRCWNYRESVGESEEHPSLCKRCVHELQGIGGSNE